MKRLLRAHSTFLTVLFLAASCFAALIVLLLADSIGKETGNDFVNAASIAPYQDLSLVGTVGIDQNPGDAGGLSVRC